MSLHSPKIQSLWPKKSWFWNQEWLVIKANSRRVCNWSAPNKLFGYLKRIKTLLLFWVEAQRRKTLTCWERGNNIGKSKQANAWPLIGQERAKVEKTGLASVRWPAYDIKLDHLFNKKSYRNQDDLMPPTLTLLCKILDERDFVLFLLRHIQ